MATGLLCPSNAIEGGLIDDFDGKITDAKFIMYDYNGKQPDNPVPALGIEIELADGSTKHESYYSAGDAKYWRPNEQGTSLIPVGDKTSLTKSCKLMVFLTELVNAGFSEDKLRQDDITCLKGLLAHWTRKADKERKGLVRTDDQQKKGEQSTLVVSKILAMPGEAPKVQPIRAAVGAPAAASSAPATTATAPAAGTTDVDDDVTNLLLELIPANGGTVAKSKLSQLTFKHIGKDHPLLAKRTAITQRAFNDEFLKAGANSGLWAYDGTNVSIAG